MGGKAAIILVMGLGFVLGYIGLNLNNTATKAVGNMSVYSNMTASNNLAKTGANVGLAKFYQDTSWSGSITQTFNGPLLKGTFVATCTHLTGDTVRLRSVSTYPVDYRTTMRDTIEVYFNKAKKKSFTLFAWMTHDENGVTWITGDTVWGRVHSNSILKMSGKPVFHEKVTTSKSISPKPGKSPNFAIFKKSYETGIAPVDLPTDFNELITASTTGGRVFVQNPIWLTLSAGTAADGDGKVYVRTTQAGPIIDSISLSDPAFNGVILGNGRVNVSGTLDGRLSIASLTDMYIQDDILCERNPQTTPSSDDMLGLISENNVVVANNVANQVNCEIQASVFSRTGSFTAESYNTGAPRGLLKLLGSIVQKTRGPVGTFSGSTLLTGYLKRYRYDNRLADVNVRPPYYPGFLVKTYAITNWWESYSVAKLY